MYTINRQIIDTFTAFDSNNNSLTGLTFAKLLSINGLSANPSAVVVVEDANPSSGGIYYLTYTPTLTGSHYVNLVNPAAIFDANYYVTSGFDEVWTNSGTGVLNSISITASTNNLLIAESVWGYSISGSAVTAGSMGQALSATWQVQTGKWEMVANQLNLYDKDGVTILRQFNLFDTSNNPSLTGVVKRVPI